MRHSVALLGLLGAAGCAAVPDRPEEIGVQKIVLSEERRQSGEAVRFEALRAEEASTVSLGDVFFETAEAGLTPDGIVRVAEIAAQLQADPGLIVVVEGHADVRGGEAGNLALSEARAETVALRLESEGVETRRIVYGGVGEAGATAGTEQQDRRVDITLIAES